jgi:Bacterial Ig domain
MSKFIRFTLFSFLFLFLAAPVFAQSAEFQIHARRDFGYGNGADVRGNFSLTILGDQANIRSVTYLIDGSTMGTASAAPFKLSFVTGSYPAGVHALSAVVDTVDGRQVTTPTVRLNFLSAGQESQQMQRTIFPLLGSVFGVILLILALQVLVMRRSGPPAPGSTRNYGLKGGAICPRCGRAFAIHFFSINLIGGYFDRCDYCGKWAFVRSRSRAELDAAERAELSAAQASETSLPAAQGAQTEEERLKKMLDDSKFSE